MQGLIHEAIRKICSGMHSDELFTDREKIKKEILEDSEIQSELKRVGISIDNIVIDEPLLPSNVIKAKNDIRQAELDKAVAREQAEALRIRIIEEAKAKMEARDLEGQGAEKFRTNILRGLAEQAQAISDASGGRITMAEAMDHITELYRLGVQETAAASNNKVFFMPTESSGRGVSFTKADLIASLDAAKEQNNGPAPVGGHGPAAAL